jgi:hypothetical protein
VHVQNVNTRKEKHGEADVLAVDVSLRLMMGANGTEWDGLLRELLGDESYIEAFTEYWCGVCSSIIFAKEHEQHRAVFQYAPDTASLVTLTHAKVNKYKVDCEDLGITFRVQASEVGGTTVGKLAELIGMTIRLSLFAEQQELALEPSEAEGGVP